MTLTNLQLSHPLGVTKMATCTNECGIFSFYYLINSLFIQVYKKQTNKKKTILKIFPTRSVSFDQQIKKTELIQTKESHEAHICFPNELNLRQG